MKIEKDIILETFQITTSEMIFVFRNLREHDISNKQNNTLLSQLSQTYFYNRTRTDRSIEPLS